MARCHLLTNNRQQTYCQLQQRRTATTFLSTRYVSTTTRLIIHHNTDMFSVRSIGKKQQNLHHSVDLEIHGGECNIRSMCVPYVSMYVSSLQGSKGRNNASSPNVRKIACALVTEVQRMRRAWPALLLSVQPQSYDRYLFL